MNLNLPTFPTSSGPYRPLPSTSEADSGLGAVDPAFENRIAIINHDFGTFTEHWHCHVNQRVDFTVTNLAPWSFVIQLEF